VRRGARLGVERQPDRSAVIRHHRAGRRVRVGRHAVERVERRVDAGDQRQVAGLDRAASDHAAERIVAQLDEPFPQPGTAIKVHGLRTLELGLPGFGLSLMPRSGRHWRPHLLISLSYLPP